MHQRRNFYKGGFWHIYNRGVAKQDIFRDKDDFIYYLYKVKEVLKKHSLSIHTYSFLKNHLHYLIEQTTEVPPGKFFSSLHTSLGMHINKKYNRIGHLFQGRYNAKPVKNTDYLIDLSIYINLNIILEKLQHLEKTRISKRRLEALLEAAENYPWSSYPAYLGQREDGITNTKFILSVISDNQKKAQKEYQKLAKEMLISKRFLKIRDLTFEEPS